MPVPDHVAAEARRCLARFRLPCPQPPRSDVPSRGEMGPATPGCHEPASAATATPERSRPTIADDNARADGSRLSMKIRQLLAGGFSLSRSSRPSTLSHPVMPPPIPAKESKPEKGAEALSQPEKKESQRQPEKEEKGFSHHSERAVNQECLEVVRLHAKRNQKGSCLYILLLDVGPMRRKTNRTLQQSFSPCKRIKSLSSLSDKYCSVRYHTGVALMQSISRECREQNVPEGVMTISLHKYQKMGLDWMLFREKSSHCAGGILADQQGLGKTIQVIALILKERVQQSKFMSIDSDREATVVNKEPKDLLFHKKPAHHVTNFKPCAVDRISTTVKPAGGTLLVCPKSILTQWDKELYEKIAKDAKLSVHVYYGPSRTMDSQELTKHDVVITSYNMVKQHFNSDGHKNNPIAGVRWFRIVLDEAHEIRNGDSLVAQACWELEAERRWCISGTPVQNKFNDLYSYLRFLRYRPYSEYTSFRSLLMGQYSKYARSGKTKLEILWEIVRLQRMEDTWIDGEPIIKLPPKTIQIRKIILTPPEQKFDLWLKQCYAETLMDFTFERILALLKERQLACDHPCLVKNRSDYEQCSTIFEKSYVSSKMKAIIDILNSIVNKQAFTASDSNTESSTTESAPEKVLVFSQFTMMLDLLEPLLNSNGIQFRRFDGKMSRKDRDEAVKDFSRNPEVTVLLASLKASGFGLNMVAASHVIITDPWWNPCSEDQAIARAHRIGQTRPVTVYRLVVKDSVEERALEVQEEKRTSIRLVYEGKGILDRKLTKDVLKFVYG